MKRCETLRTDFPKELPHVEKSEQTLSPPFTSNDSGHSGDSDNPKSERVEDDYEAIERAAIQQEDAA